MTIAIPSHLSDSELTAQLSRFARDERHTTAQVVAHLAEFDTRRLHLGAGYSSLFAYCRDVLGLSEDAAYNRIEAARAGRMFPVVLEWLADGSLSLTVVRMLARLLTAENHQELLSAARRRGKREVEELIARRFPKPDTPASVRKVPERGGRPLPTLAKMPIEATPTAVSPVPLKAERGAVVPAPPSPPAPSVHRPAVKPLATDRYEIRFTASTSTRDKLKVAQELLRHAVPTGDVAVIFDRAMSALIEQLSRKKLAVVRKPQPRPRPTATRSRHLPAAVKRAVWDRDRGRCAFVGAAGHRCAERAFLEYHHVEPYASGGEATVSNIQLRCRGHNGYEADVFYGPDRSRGEAGAVGEGATEYAVCWGFAPVPERVGHGSGPRPNVRMSSPALTSAPTRTNRNSRP